MVQQAGGTVRIESVPGQGSQIRMYLPRTARRLRPGAEPSTGAVAGPGRAATVLVVDDDPDIREVLVASLDALGCSVLQAHDGPSSLQLLAETGPDLLIVDFAMPGMNGAEVASAVRERWPNLPIVFASGYAETAAIERAAGRDTPVLRKPFRIDQLQTVLAEVLTAAAAR
ncbi:MAG: response regulator, partial [Acetobacteraceae bacterium]|nr:response regulator [Acetobacteraceae bacterium]